MKLPKLLLGSLIGQCLIAGLLVLTFIKGANNLEAQQDDVQRYQEIKAKIAIDIKQTVIDYLNTGDATILAKAEAQLEVLENSLRQINNDKTASIIYQVALLRLDLSQKYRAAGKLGNNAQAVLVNAERELADNIKSLAEYGETGMDINPGVAMQYQMLAAEMAQTAHVLSLLRSQYLDSRSETTQSSIAFQLTQLKNQVKQTQSLAPLGLMEESLDVDDFFGTDEDAIANDKIITITDNLNSLIQRYPKEIDYTQQQLAQTHVLKDELLTRTNQVALNVKAIEHSLFGVKSNAFVNTQYTLYALIAISVILALAHFISQHRLFLQPLQQFHQAIRKQAENGGVFSIEPQRFKGDFSQIVSDYNRLVEQTKTKMSRLKLLYQTT
ncbi:hypothetical protein [Motilimonas eburnea]|uniref:hypothetical protein n=1 Tax=Motilimonas eburnea TaxID=1737488 RepID=UPI001E523825|nr:hypothetical protein [Motilimonas eburnea]MCE2572608.1 hypothetical protein [Motilimonas eburnea]